MPAVIGSERSKKTLKTDKSDKADKTDKTDNECIKPSEGLNLAILVGVLSSAPETREIPDRGEVATLQVRVSSLDGVTSVPVTMWSPPAWLLAAGEGTPVLVAGIVRRRFWRTPAGTTSSRVDVEATSVTRDGARQRASLAKRAEAILASAALTPLPK
jgi:single-strand DNA-binding protein